MSCCRTIVFQDKCGWTDQKTDRDEKEKIEGDKYKKQNIKRHKLERQNTKIHSDKSI